MTEREALLFRATEQTRKLDLLAARLEESLTICLPFDLDTVSSSEIRELEALTARFERALDIFVRAFLRTLDELEDTKGGTIIDVLNRAEKRLLIDSADDFVEMRLRRNRIAHSYLEVESLEMAAFVRENASKLIAALRRGQNYRLPER